VATTGPTLHTDLDNLRFFPPRRTITTDRGDAVFVWPATKQAGDGERGPDPQLTTDISGCVHCSDHNWQPYDEQGTYEYRSNQQPSFQVLVSLILQALVAFLLLEHPFVHESSPYPKYKEHRTRPPPLLPQFSYALLTAQRTST
jgi:hypothetical protein